MAGLAAISPKEVAGLAVISLKRLMMRPSIERTYNRYQTFSSCLSYASALCLIALSFLRYGYLRYASLRHAYFRHAYSRCGYLRYDFLRYVSLRYASFRDGHLQNRLFAIQLWIDAFMIWTILFQILIIEFCQIYLHKYEPILL